jgi:hypothetical protein
LECGARSALILGLKGHGGWKSSSTSEDYIEDCIENKIQFARTNLHGDTNKEFSKPTTSMCNQEAKENTGHDNFDHANIAATPLMLFHCSGKEGRLQELYLLWRTINLGRQISDISKKSMQATIYCHYD